jgi:hypothetical protein
VIAFDKSFIVEFDALAHEPLMGSSCDSSEAFAFAMQSTSSGHPSKSVLFSINQKCVFRRIF